MDAAATMGSGATPFMTLLMSVALLMPMPLTPFSALVRK